MAIGDIYRVRHQQTYLGVQAETTYFVEQTVGAGGAAGVTLAFVSIIEVSIVAVQQLTVTSVQVVAENLTDPTDFDTRPTVVTGIRVGEPMPPYAAWGYILETTDKRIRAGGKRFVGISETDQSGGIRAAGVIAATDNLAAVLNASFSAGPETYKIVLRTPGNVATLGLPLVVQVAGVNYARVTTQNSRKFAV